jgi:isoleucyl-tRNA synthetase
MCLQILGNCLYYFSLITAPFAPFMAESVYQTLLKISDSHFSCSTQYDAHKKSIHFHKIPTEPLWVSDGNLLETFDYFSELIDLTRIIRAKRVHADGKSASSIKLAFPKMTILSRNQDVLDQLKAVLDYIQKELNVICVEFSTQLTSDYISFTLQPNISDVKLRITDGKTIGKIMKYFKQLTPAQVDEIAFNKNDVQIDADTTVYYHELIVNRVPKNDNIVCSTNLTVMYDTSITPEILDKYYSKLFYRGYQDTRKQACLVQTDLVQLEYVCSDELHIILQKHSVLENATRVMEIPNDPDNSNRLITKDVDVSLEQVTMSLVKLT